MAKLLLLVLAILGGLWWFARRGPSDRGPSGRSTAGHDAGRASSGETMVRCEYCDTHVPQSAAVCAGKHTFCSEEHRAAAGY